MRHLRKSYGLPLWKVRKPLLPPSHIHTRPPEQITCEELGHNNDLSTAADVHSPVTSPPFIPASSLDAKDARDEEEGVNNGIKENAMMEVRDVEMTEFCSEPEPEPGPKPEEPPLPPEREVTPIPTSRLTHTPVPCPPAQHLPAPERAPETANAPGRPSSDAHAVSEPCTALWDELFGPELVDTRLGGAGEKNDQRGRKRPLGLGVDLERPAKRPHVSAAQRLAFEWVDKINQFLEEVESNDKESRRLGMSDERRRHLSDGCGSNGYGCKLSTWRALKSAMEEVEEAKSSVCWDVIRVSTLWIICERWTNLY